MALGTTKRPTPVQELDDLRSVGRLLIAQRNSACVVIEQALADHGPSRHPLVDVLLDVRNLLRPPREL